MRLAAVTVLACAASVLGQGDTLVLRGFEQPPPGQAMGVGPQGVQVRSPQGDVVIIGWDRVLQLPTALAEAGEPFDQLSLESWRARARIERGDLVLAEPVLQGLFESARAGAFALRGPTGLVVAEGLLRCRLARGAGAAAIEPWLVWLDAAIVRQPRTTYAHRTWAQRAGLPTVIDPATELCPMLPPMWLATPALQLTLQYESTEGERDKATALRALYQAAARHELGQRVEQLPEVPREAATELVRDIVASRVLDAPGRTTARARLEAALPSAATPWLTAWLHAAIGRSLVLEDSHELKLRGIAQLLRVHVLHREDGPALADICLAEAATTLHDIGQHDTAVALARELARASAQSPALSWPPLAQLLQGAMPTPSAQAPLDDAPQDDPATAGGPP